MMIGNARVRPGLFEELSQTKIKWCYAQEGDIDPRSGAHTLWRMLGEPEEIRALRKHASDLEEEVARLKALIPNKLTEEKDDERS